MHRPRLVALPEHARLAPEPATPTSLLFVNATPIPAPERVPIARTETTRRDRAPWFVALAVLACGLLWIGSEGTYDGDERYYLDATLRMLASGDWWKPEFADGSARLNKPLLDYWLIGSSFQLFGVSLFAARLPFLIAGALVVALTGRLARELFPEEPRAPLLASAIAASNATLATLTVRCTPDILVVLSTTIAWIGLAELLVAERPRRRAAAWLWCGIGLAAAAKGGLAIVLVVTSVGLVVWRRRAGARRALVHAPAMLFAVSVAAVCLVPLWLVEEAPGGPSFVHDQVAGRIATSPLDIARNFLAYFVSLLRHHLPWVLAPVLLFIGGRDALRSIWLRDRRGIVAVLLFTLAVFVVFASSNTHRARYLAPTYPALACSLAVFALPLLEWKWTARVLRSLVVTVTLAAILVAALLARVDALSAVVVALTGIVLAVGMRRATRNHLGTLFALAMSAVLLVVVPAIRDAFRSNYYALAADSERLDATWGFDPSTPNLVRVLSAGRLDPRPWPKQPSDADFDSTGVVLVMGSTAEELAQRGWRLDPCGFRARRMRAGDVPHLLRESDPRAWFAAQGQPVYRASR